jgi:uncharacterized protein involved in exopolysaccharide biosynthesis
MAQSPGSSPDPASRSNSRSPAPGPASGTAQSFLDYLEIITRNWRLIAGVTATAAVISVVYSLLLTNIYTARAMILPSQDDKNMTSSMMAQLGGLAGLAGVSVGGPTTTDLYVSLLRSDAVKIPVIDRFKLLEVYKVKYHTDASKLLDQTAVITAGKKDGIVTVFVDDKDPKLAAELANAHVEELGKLLIRLNVTGAGQNRAFLEERLTKAKVDLAKAEDDLKVFQSRNKSVNATEQAKASIEGIAKLHAELVSREVQLSTMRRTYTESSQEVKNMAATVRQLKDQVARLEGSGSGSAIPTVGAAPALGQEYIRLMREFKIQETLVELLTKQYEMTRINEAKDVAPFQVVLKARPPERKSKPSRLAMVKTATLTAFFASLVLVFAREKFNSMAEADRERWKSIIRLRRKHGHA